MQSVHHELQAKISSQINRQKKSTSAEATKRTEETRRQINTPVAAPRPMPAERTGPLVLSKKEMRKFRYPLLEN